MTPRRLPFALFLKTFEFVPRAAVNLLAVRKDSAILLTKRKKPPFAGSWHLPGSFVLKQESLVDCIRRVAREEIGCDVTDIKLAGAFDDLVGDPRGHVVDLVYQCKSKGTPKPSVGDSAENRFFKKLPRNIGFNHRKTLALLGYT